MAYVAPNTTIQFFKNTGLSMTHENSLYFASEQEKNLYFTNWSSQVGVVQQTYQRANRSYCRVQSTMAVMYNVDYMRFVNINFENKWFYAFVTAVNYINNITVEVEYVLDPLMTWMGTFELKQCYIERQHTTNDGVGNNIAEEGLPIGDYITEEQTWLETYSAGTSRIVAAYGLPNGAVMTGGMASGAYVEVLNNSTSAITNFVTRLTENNNIDSIVSLTLVPAKYADGGGTSLVVSTHNLAKPYHDFSGYMPNNNKLFCYPYKYLEVSNTEGNTQEYRYEYFNQVPDATSTGQCTFETDGCAYAGGCEVALEPVNYADSLQQEGKMTITHFPSIAWSYNSYEAYLAQKNAYYPQELAKSFVSGMLGINTMGGASNYAMADYGGLSAKQSAQQVTAGNIGFTLGVAESAVQAGKNVLGTVFNNLIINNMIPQSPMVVKGAPAIDLSMTMGEKGFVAFKKCITKNYAMMIDSYFDMYGYAIRQHGTPNMNARPHWTFVKTIGCDCGGNVPASDKKQIEDIFDNGVRFWHNLIEMGNYSLNNQPA